MLALSIAAGVLPHECGKGGPTAASPTGSAG